MRKPILFMMAMVLLAATPQAQVTQTQERCEDSSFKGTAGSKKRHKSMWDTVYTFNAGATSQVGIETDGANFYTVSWNSNSIIRYSMNRNVLDTFTIAGVSQLRDITYDGTYFYASNASMNLYKLDMANEVLVQTLPVTCAGVSVIRHIAYDPTLDNGNGGFWIGNWTELGAIKMDGSQLIASTTTEVSDCYGSAYDPYSDPSNPCLWLFCQTGSSALVTFYQFDINSYSLTGVSRDCTDDFSNIASNASAGGACTYVDHGVLILAGNIQQDPNLIVAYELVLLADTAAPNQVTGLTVTPGDNGALTAKINWANPSINFGGTILSELTAINVYIDNNAVPSYTNNTPVIGGNDSCMIVIPSPGRYIFRVVGSNSKGEGVPASVSAWIGEDIPVAPTNVQLTVNQTDATLKWNKVITGAQGYYFNPANIRYDVVRYPDAVTVATGLTDTVFTETLTLNNRGTCYYGVAAVNTSGESMEGVSNDILIFGDTVIRWYVSQGGGNLGTDGFSWATASNDLQAVINKAIEKDTIWVAQGMYLPVRPANNLAVINSANRNNAFVLKKGVSVYGGFAGTETGLEQRNWETNPAVLSGDIGVTGNSTDNAYHVVIAAGDVGTVCLDGFTVTNGNANGSGSITVNANTVYQYSGGGIYNTYSSPVLTNVTISNNTASSNGGGIYNNSSSPVLTNVTINHNTSSSGGGVYGNHDGQSTAVGTYTNCLFNNNHAASNGGAVYYDDGNGAGPVFTNCTFSGDNAGNGNLLYYYKDNTGSLPQFRNCIIDSVSAGNMVRGSTNGRLDSIVFSYTLTSYGSLGNNVNNAANILSTDPLFVDALHGDYRLLAGSPAIDAGNNGYYNPGSTPDLSLITTDIKGNPRINSGVVDLGAYESADSDAPGAVTNMEVIPVSEGSLTVKIRWVNPGLVVGGGILTELTAVSLYLDNAVAPSYTNSTPVIGGSDSCTVVIPSAGEYSFTVVGFNSKGEGLPASVSAWIGEDIPAAPANVLLTANGMDVTLEWNKVITGTQGYYVNPANIRYDVVRYPDAVTVAAGVTDTVFTETLTFDNRGICYYGITATNTTATSAEGISNDIMILGDTVIRWYVSREGGTTGQDGFSWATASNDLQAVLNKAIENDTVWVAQGTYLPIRPANNLKVIDSANRDNAFVLKKGVSVYGGFAGTETGLAQRNWETNPVVLSGDIGVAGDSTDNTYHIVIAAGDMGTACLDGFIITEGYANGNNTINVNSIAISQSAGAGVHTAITAASSLTYINLVIEKNIAGGDGGGVYNDTSSSPLLKNVNITSNSANYGGGIYNYQSSPELVDVIISKNKVVNAYSCGAGMYNRSSSSPVLMNVLITENTASGGNNFGGGIYNSYSSPVLTGVTISNNTAYHGGGIYNTSSSLVLTNVTVSHNTSSYGGGVYGIHDGQSTAIGTYTNCLFSNNHAASEGGAIYYDDGDGAGPVFTNCTFSGDSAGNGNLLYYYKDGAGSIPQFRNCIIDSVSAGNMVSGTSAGIDNIIFKNVLTPYASLGNNAGNTANTVSTDPFFVDRTNANYRLALGSPCVGIGDPAYFSADSIPDLSSVTTDIDGYPRFKSGLIDLGAYQNLHSAVSLTGITVDGYEASLKTGSTLEYEVTIPYTDSATIVVMPSNPLAVVDPDDVGRKEVSTGLNTFTIGITSEDNTETETYSLEVTVEKKEQTITFAPLAAVKVGDPDFSPGATASSGLAVSYTSSNLSVATIVNNQVHIIGAGTTTIIANQAGNNEYEAAATVSQPLTVNEGNAIIAVDDIYQLRIYPNPAYDKIYLQIDNMDLQQAMVSIYDSYGKLLKQVTVREDITVIDLEGLSSGVYVMQLQSEEKIQTCKFIKQ